MLHKVRKFKTLLVLTGIVVAWLLLAWMLPTSSLEAADWFPALLTFQSPIGNPVLSLSKTVNNPAPTTGSTLVYTLAYSNTNPGSQAFNVHLYDFLPAGLQLISTNPSYSDYTDGVLTFDAPTIGPSTDNVEISVVARVREGYESLYNHALVTADGISPTQASLLSTIYPPLRELALSKTGYEVVLLDGALNYQLRCENTGAITLTNVVVMDVLPNGVAYQSATHTPDLENLPLLQWNIGDLAVGQVWEVTVQANAPSAVGVITNTLLASAQQLSPVNTLFATRVISTGAILQINKTASASDVRLGDTLVYTLSYENIGNMTATATMITDTYPSGIVIVSTTPVTTTSTSTYDMWNVGDVAPGGSGDIVINTTVGGLPGRTMHNSAVIDAPGADVFGDQSMVDVEVGLYLTYLPQVLRH